MSKENNWNIEQKFKLSMLSFYNLFMELREKKYNRWCCVIVMRPLGYKLLQMTLVTCDLYCTVQFLFQDLHDVRSVHQHHHSSRKPSSTTLLYTINVRVRTAGGKNMTLCCRERDGRKSLEPCCSALCGMFAASWPQLQTDLNSLVWHGQQLCS